MRFYGKKGFTLLELLLVLVVISIIMTITMRFSSSSFDKIYAQDAKTKFFSTYQQILLDGKISSYFRGQKYDSLDIEFSSGALGFDYCLQPQNTCFSGYQDEQVRIHTLSLNGNDVDKVELKFVPYLLGCSLSSDEMTGSEIDFVFSKSVSQSCFHISSQTCVLKEVSCP